MSNATTLSGLRYRLEPYPGQARWLRQAAGACRFVHNLALAYREVAWLAAKSAGATGIGANLGYVHQCTVLTDLRQQYPWLQQCPVAALRGGLKNLDRAFDRFFAGQGGYPKFQRRGEDDSINFYDAGGIAVSGDWVRLPVLGWLRFRQHRPFQGQIRNVSLTLEGPHWYISFTVAGSFTLPNAGAAPVGIDCGVDKPLVLSTGEVISCPVATPKEHKRLIWLQRQAARRVKGSERQQRTYAKMAKLKRHLARRRIAATHKATTRIATTFSLVAIEDLHLKGMTASAKGTLAEPGRNVRAKAGLNRALLARAHGDFRRMLTYKCERSGAKLVAVHPAHTSQTCSRCQHRAAENRKSQAVFHCVNCGLEINADLNAAINIREAGSAPPAQGGSGLGPADELRTRPRARAA